MGRQWYHSGITVGSDYHTIHIRDRCFKSFCKSQMIDADQMRDLCAGCGTKQGAQRMTEVMSFGEYVGFKPVKVEATNRLDFQQRIVLDKSNNIGT